MALQNVVVTVICDQFPSFKYGRVALITSIFGFLSGLMYLTPVCIIFHLISLDISLFELSFHFQSSTGWSMDDNIGRSFWWNATNFCAGHF